MSNLTSPTLSNPELPGGRVRQDQAGMNVIFVHSSLDDAGLSVYAFRIYCHLARRANNSANAWPGVQSMADKCGMSKNTVKAALNELLERKFILVLSAGGGRETNNYLLTPSSAWELFETSNEAPGQEVTGSGGDPLGVTTCPAGGQEVTGSQSGGDHEGTPLRKSKKGKSTKGGGGDTPAPADDPSFPKSKLLKLWNDTVPTLRPIVTIAGKRETFLRARWGEHPTLEFWASFFAKVEASDKLTGRVKMSREWTADFDWIIIPGNFAKVLEGKYANPQAKAPASTPPGPAMGFFQRRAIEQSKTPNTEH